MSDFESLPGFILTPEIERAFSKDGITAPTEAQRAAFEPILAGKHVVLDSGTGTGKTLAYLLPLLQRLTDESAGRAVCLAPAAELAVQTLRVATNYKSDELNAGALVGGGNQKKQKDRVQKSTRLIVGTPGRVLEVVRERKLKGVKTFVLDEPEPILSSKEGRFLLEVLSRPPRPQLIVVGATFGKNSAELIERFMGESVVRAKTEENPLVGRIKHSSIRVRNAGDRDLQLARFLEQEKADRAIVYINQSHLIRHLYRYLTDSGVPTVSLSQDRTKQQCKQALQTFSEGEAQVLLTTDRAATGLDIPNVPWVMHYELPRSIQAYVHRAGRTARAGNVGRSIALVANEDRTMIKRLERELSISFEEFSV